MVSRLGEVVNTSGKTIIVKGDKITTKALGRIVINKNMKDIGRVVDVFGPVEHPYAKVVLFSEIKNFCETILYLR